MSYDSLGRKTGIIYPDGTSSEIQYFKASSIIKNIYYDGKLYASYSGINQRNQAGQIAYLNGVTTNYSYDTRGLLKNLTTSKDANQLLDLTYSFSSSGNVNEIKDSLISELTEKAHRRMHFAPGSTRLLSHDVKDSGGFWVPKQSYVFSAAGTMLQNGGSSYVYDQRNKLIQTIKADGSQAVNVYDYDESRFVKIFKPVGKPEIRTYFIGAGYEVREKWENGTRRGTQITKYVFGAAGEKLASITDSPALVAAIGETSSKYAFLSGLKNFNSIANVIDKIKFMAIAVLLKKNQSPVTTATLYLIAALLLLLVYLRYSWGIAFFFKNNTNLQVKFMLPLGNYGYGLALQNKKEVKDNRHKFGGFRQFTALASILLVVNLINCSQTGFQTGTLPNSTPSGNVNPTDNFIYSTIDFDDIYSGLPAGTRFYHGNHLNTASLITDENGQEVMHMTYTPYGELDQNASGKYNPTTGKIEPIVADAKEAHTRGKIHRPGLRPRKRPLLLQRPLLFA